jgi:hypothetical protein
MNATKAIIAYLHDTAFASGLSDGEVGPPADAIEIIALFERE